MIILNLEWEPIMTVITPITSIVAVLIYSVALFTAIRQNRMLLSQNLRPHFEELINDYIKLGIDIEATPMIPGSKDLNAFNYREQLKEAFYKLKINPDYEQDLQIVREKKL